MSHLGLMILGVHSPLLLLHGCPSITGLMHCRICAGQVQVVLQLAGWPQDPQRVILQLLHRPEQLEKKTVREEKKKEQKVVTRFIDLACSYYRLVIKWSWLAPRPS